MTSPARGIARRVGGTGYGVARLRANHADAIAPSTLPQARQSAAGCRWHDMRNSLNVKASVITVVIPAQVLIVAHDFKSTLARMKAGVYRQPSWSAYLSKS